MSGQEQNGGAPKKERKTTPEYAPKDITELLFWSFHMSQGSGLNLEAPTLVHARIFPALFALNPKLPAAIRQWMKVNKWDNELLSRDFQDEDWTDDSRLINDRIVEEYVQRVYNYRENPVAHAQGNLDMEVDHRAEAYKALQALLKAARDFSPQSGERDIQIKNLAPLIIHRDIELLEQIEMPDPLSIVQGTEGNRLRQLKGYSMFCLLALSEKREEVRGFLPPEYQELWEEMGTYVREQYDALPEGVKDKLVLLTQKFKETTGEEIVLEAK
ncbi:hypothetical protein K2Y00_00260 [Patescibacteria group bacterium]|nr:hypothetical protein [Patescibacteria group bacterium]